VLGYSIQHFSPHREVWITLLEAFALLLLVVSFWLSYKRLEYSVGAANYDHDMVTDMTHISLADKALATGAPLYTERGIVMSREEIRFQMEQNPANIASIIEKLEALSPKMAAAHHWRFRFLIFGLIALLIAKTLGVLLTH
jgi:hypothetical protein